MDTFAARLAKDMITAKLAHSRRERPLRPTRLGLEQLFLTTTLYVELGEEIREVTARMDIAAGHNYVSRGLVNEIASLFSLTEDDASVELFDISGLSIQIRKSVRLSFIFADEVSVSTEFFFILETSDIGDWDVILGSSFISSRQTSP
jgi:hypothetical protein